MWKGTINATNGDVTFADGGGTSIGAATSIVQFSSSTLAYAAATGEKVQTCTVEASGDLVSCVDAPDNDKNKPDDIPAFGGLVIEGQYVYLCK